MAMAALAAAAPVAGLSAGALRCGTPAGPSSRDLRCSSAASAFTEGQKLQQQRCAIKAARATPLIRAATAELEVLDPPTQERFRLGNLSPQPGSRKRNKRKGRDIAAGQGASCGFGMRGQKFRSGSGVRPGFEGGQMPLYRRLPKLKEIAGGMGAGLSKYVTVNLDDIEAANFAEGEEVSLEALIAKRILNPSGREERLRLKVLSNGELTTKLTIRAGAFSESAKAKLTGAGSTLIRFRTLAVKAMSSSYGGAESLSGDDSVSSIDDEIDLAEEPLVPEEEMRLGWISGAPGSNRGSLRAVGILAAILGVVSLAALGLTLASGGPNALLSIVSKSGFPAAFALIFVSEIGDKTFFIAALLAMRQSKWLVLLGASAALAVMTVISVIIGKLFQKVPAQLQTTLPVGEYAAVALLIWFGLRSIKNAWDTPSAPAGAQGQTGELGELAEAEEFLKQSDDKKATTGLEVLVEAFTLIFVAEWGDRSMLATIALGAAQSPWGVATGAIAGHVLATLLAVVGGSLLARYLSEKLIGYFGGFLFLIFAAATLAGVF